MKLSEKMAQASAERRLREIDKLQTRQEETALKDWERVAQVAEKLRSEADASYGKYADELATLAQRNISFASALGVEFSVDPEDTMASGMEIFDRMVTDELTDQVIEDPLPVDPEPPVSFETHTIPEMANPPAAPQRQEVATFKHVVDGHDGKLALYEDASGHFVAVRTSRLA